MPTIAQKLCHEIVEPLLVPSSNEMDRSKKSLRPISGNSSIKMDRPTKSIIIERKKVVSQLEPTSKTVINKFKSKDRILRKEFIDIGVNTLISGPLRTDNNCITNVRRRDNPCGCKHQKKIHFNVCSKQMQTLNKSSSQSDKACHYYIDTVNCGTQFMENLNSKLKTQISNRLLLKKSNECAPPFNCTDMPHASSRTGRPTKVIQSGKRWALSSYPVRGPDF